MSSFSSSDRLSYHVRLSSYSSLLCLLLRPCLILYLLVSHPTISSNYQDVISCQVVRLSSYSSLLRLLLRPRLILNLLVSQRGWRVLILYNIIDRHQESCVILTSSTTILVVWVMEKVMMLSYIYYSPSFTLY